MRIVVAAVGRLKAGPDRELSERYRDRAAKVGRRLGVRAVDVIEVKESRAPDGERRRTEEAIALAITMPNDAVRVTLDNRGESISSDSFADRIRGWRDGGHQAVGFAIGGPDGLATGLRDNANLILAFGAITWPHQLVRIMLMEQIYRAMTILSGHPYHRE
jgi:23S rRNA (pseudouridine1915-N3)-methyltransferase